MSGDVAWLRSELTQDALRDMAEALGMTPGDRLWITGSARDGWWLSGCAEGDCILPMSKGARTAREAYTHAYGWLAPELGS